MKIMKFAAVICALSLTAAALSGCDTKNTQPETTTMGVVSATIPPKNTEPKETISLPEYQSETRPLEEGDDYAINKINNRSSGEVLPGGYKLVAFNEEKQGKLYANGKARIIISAYNYKEDLQDIEKWAENACVVTTVTKMFDACDTEFQTPPVKQNILGFDGLRYYYDFVQNEFVDDPENPGGEKIKSPIGYHKGISDFFCSTQDAYAVTFETSKEDWEEELKNYEAFMNDLEITPTEY